MKQNSTSAVGNNLHRQLLHQLRTQALSAECGSRFPSESSVSRRFKVSRSTVNRVYNELEAAGYLIRKQGSGTFIPETPLYRICYLLPFDGISNNHDMELVRRGEALRKRCDALSIPFEYIEATTSTRNNRDLNSDQFKQISKNTVLVISGYYFRGIFDQLIRQNTNVVFISAQHELDVLYKERLKMWQLIEIDRHGGMCNIMFADGHVDTFAAKGNKNTFTADNNPYKNDYPFNSFNNKNPYDPFWRPEI